MNLAFDLKRVVKGDVSTAVADLELASHDASIFEVVPEVVVAPKSVEDIEKLVKYVNGQKADPSTGSGRLSLTARSAGTDMSGGPLSESIILDFLKYFVGIRNIDEAKQEATVLPGTYYRDFEKATLEKGLLMPSYPASKGLCTVGGIVANNSGGEKSLTYGKTEEYVKELKVVLADGKEYTTRALNKPELEAKMGQNDFEGKIYRDLWKLIETNRDLLKRAKPKVHKNSAGYYLWNVWDGKTFDINKLITGSQGTLGLVTEITFKLVRPKTHSTLLVLFLHDLKALAQVVENVLKHKPESFESYDDHTMKLAVRFMPDMLKTLGAKNLFSLGWKFWPELKMILTGGVPKLILVAEFTGDSEEEIYQKAKDAEKDLEAHQLRTHIQKKDDHITRSDAEEDKYWTIRRESFALLRKHVHGKHTAPFIDDIIVRPEKLNEFLPALNAVTKEFDITYTIAGHIGDGNFHIIPLMDFNRPDFKQIISGLSKKVYELVIKNEGSITGEHNDGLIRTPYLEQMYGREVVELFQKTKAIFDPQNIFNPGKKTDATLAYGFEHIRHWPKGA
ncbi:MAG TPA: FAD-binding oxidoreductase [Candidatus Paceibacterota bacterium]